MWSIFFSGHTRQGLKCRICKMNVHFDCQEKAVKCQTKARLLRRQKSTSEIETRNLEIPVEDESKDLLQSQFLKSKLTELQKFFLDIVNEKWYIFFNYSQESQKFFQCQRLTDDYQLELIVNRHL